MIFGETVAIINVYKQCRKNSKPLNMKRCGTCVNHRAWWCWPTYCSALFWKAISVYTALLPKCVMGLHFICYQWP